ncbi:MAG TPA: aspartate--tRNA ligase [Clostridiales bacterium]|nr:aspartate--tRNA ligase [Clostridiales bacterium]
MAEFLGDWKRTCYAGEADESLIDKETIVMGWVNTRRDFGGLIFVDLRDRSGILQIVFDSSVIKDDFRKAEKLRSEYVIAVQGKIRRRSEDTINPKIKTGTIELLATAVKILSDADTPPFELNDVDLVNEPLRLKYRYLELRTPRLQEIMRVRNLVCKISRDYLSKNGFWEIETPYLGKSTPEGARDYLVPSRVHPGSFYALSQSPQLYKQILMISGFDRYYQIARCFRDEDLRANRQPEFTQIDLEMSFVDNEEDVMTMTEGMIKELFEKIKGIQLPEKLPRLTYQEAMNRFGSDKPDTRFGLELIDISDLAQDCGFKVFSDAVKNGGSVRMINAKGFVKGYNPILSRRDIDALTDFVKIFRAKGLAWIAVKEDGIQSVITKFMPEETTQAILKRADAEAGDILFFGADKDEIVFDALGALRLKLGQTAGLIDQSRYDALWITDFPLLEYSEEEKRYVAKHHPFTSPKNQDLELLEKEPQKVRAKAYDLVINGAEVGGGSLRIFDRDIQNKMFKALGLTDEQIADRFGFFVNAFKYGTPPHGGLAFGLDRLVMLLADTDNIKDVIPFPKVQNASDLMTGAPDKVEPRQLQELSIKIALE